MKVTLKRPSVPPISSAIFEFTFAEMEAIVKVYQRAGIGHSVIEGFLSRLRNIVKGENP